MRERPILFSSPMVRALLNGTKTQTRRVVKLPHQNPLGVWEMVSWGGPNGGRTRDGHIVPLQQVIGHSRTGEVLGCPHGQPGDRLWVRETHAPQPDCMLSWEKWLHGAGGEKPIIHYAADASENTWVEKWRPSIHMPRWASRIDLEITDVRVERLRDISEADALAEGIELKLKADRSFAVHDDVCLFAALWEKTYGAGSWNANPWVWAVTFRRVEQ